jgi:hypothetical protein
MYCVSTEKFLILVPTKIPNSPPFNLSDTTIIALEGSCPISTLPNELLQCIFSFVDKLKDGVNLEKVCKKFYQIARSNPVLQTLKISWKMNKAISEQLPVLQQAIEERPLTSTEAIYLAPHTSREPFTDNAPSMQATNQEIEKLSNLFKRLTAEAGFKRESREFDDCVEIAVGHLVTSLTEGMEKKTKKVEVLFLKISTTTLHFKQKIKNLFE